MTGRAPPIVSAAAEAPVAATPKNARRLIGSCLSFVIEISLVAAAASGLACRGKN
jgi:hypothetical protein